MGDDIEGGPGWRIRGSDLRPEITDLASFRDGVAADPLADAIEALWSGDAAAARVLLEAHSPSPRVRALRADCLRDLGEHDAAVDEYDRLVDETVGTPREAVMRQHRGKALLAAGRIREAAAEFERVVALRQSGDATLLASAEQALRTARCRLIDIRRDRDAAATRSILEALPDWFGDPAAMENYASAADDTTFDSYVASADGAAVGVALVRRHFRESAELHLIAVHPAAHGVGAGTRLVERIVDELREDECLLLSVHTVGPSFEHEPYARTRRFYEHVGFIPLEEHHGLDWDGPTLILVLPLIASSSR